jgi:hypothetical protein
MSQGDKRLRSHCHRGHEMSGANTYVRTDGYWTCRECWRVSAAAFRAGVPAQRRTVADRFWSKVLVTEDDACWLWLGARSAKGYGMIKVDGKSRSAHRVSVELDGRTIPDCYEVDHTCFTPACVRPSHLDVVTPAENMRRRRVTMRPSAPSRRRRRTGR